MYQSCINGLEKTIPTAEMDVKKQFIWSNSDELKLIDLVRHYPPLWDTSNKNYPKKQLKKRIYAQIVENLKQISPIKGLTAESARIKFCRLRSYFYAEWKKKKQDVDCYHSKWVHYDRMLFLVKEEERKNYESNINISLTNGEEGKKNYNVDVKRQFIWSNSDEVKFINLVRRYPALWDRSNKNYPSKQLKRRIYSLVVENLKQISSIKELTAESARIKFCRLKSYFYAEWEKKKRDVDYYHSKWIHYDRMLFLVKEEERKKYESSLNISLTNGEGGKKNYIQHGAIVPVANYSDSNEETVLLASSQLSNEDSKPPLELRNPNISSLECDSPSTETPIILKAWSTSESNGGPDITVPKPSMLSCKDSEPTMKKKRPNSTSPVCDSSNAESTVVPKTSNTSFKGPPSFNVALGNLVVASLNQMPAEKANAATKEIFDVLLKYGNESNHSR